MSFMRFFKHFVGFFLPHVLENLEFDFTKFDTIYHSFLDKIHLFVSLHKCILQILTVQNFLKKWFQEFLLGSLLHVIIVDLLCYVETWSNYSSVSL
jgi:hypothetical protein